MSALWDFQRRRPNGLGGLGDGVLGNIVLQEHKKRRVIRSGEQLTGQPDPTAAFKNNKQASRTTIEIFASWKNPTERTIKQ